MNVSDYDEDALKLLGVKNSSLNRRTSQSSCLVAVTAMSTLPWRETLTAPLQYRRIFPDGVRMMTDILFRELEEKKV